MNMLLRIPSKEQRIKESENCKVDIEYKIEKLFEVAGKIILLSQTLWCYKFQ
jgi:hypothetical protein